jgi:bud site selection protein 20
MIHTYDYTHGVTVCLIFQVIVFEYPSFFCRAELDDDVPGGGKHYCEYCSRYFVSEKAKADHERTKQHKKRVKELQGPKPHSQADADWAAGLGMPDNGNHMS